MKVHLLNEPEAVIREFFENQLSREVHCTYGSDESAISDCEILIAGRPSRDMISSSGKLKSLIIPWAGLPPETRSLMQQHPKISVHNIHHNAGIVAEFTMTLLLATAKFIPLFDSTLRKNDWTLRYEPNPSLLLQGKTALILGYGAIGSRVGAYCRAFGMVTIGIKNCSAGSHAEDGTAIYPLSDLTQLLPEADAVIVCLPLTDKTRNLINEEKLGLMHSRAVLINIGRGHIINEKALYSALQNNRILAAGLDVWYNYPHSEDARSNTAPSSMHFERLTNVVMSPHRAGHVDEVITEKLRMDHLARLINAAASGKSMPNQVDLARGY